MIGLGLIVEQQTVDLSPLMGYAYQWVVYRGGWAGAGGLVTEYLY